jgi:hypothetical protein
MEEDGGAVLAACKKVEDDVRSLKPGLENDGNLRLVTSSSIRKSNLLTGC